MQLLFKTRNFLLFLPLKRNKRAPKSFLTNGFLKKGTKKEGAEAPSQILRFNFANFRFLAGKRKTSCRSYLELNVAFFCGCCDNINREELLNFYNGLCVNFFHYERPPFSLLIRQSRSPADFMLKLN